MFRICFSLLIALLIPLIASAAVPPPAPPPQNTETAPPVQQFAIRNVQAGFMWYTWSTFGPAERWLVTGEVVASNIPGGGCTVCVILDGTLTGFVQYEASEILDMTSYDHYDFGCWVDIPAGYFAIATIIAENDWLEEDREYIQLPPNLASAPHTAWTN